MKGKGIIITLIILLCIIAIGLIVFLCLAINGKSTWGTFKFGSKSDEVIFDEVYEANLINDIEISSTAGNVKLEESTDEKVKVVVYGEKDGNLKVDYNDSKLKIDYPGKKNNNVFFNFNFKTSEIIVYIPKSYSKNINVKLNYGDIKIADFENASINIDEDCGDIKIGKIKNVTIKNSYGETNIVSVLNKLDIKSNCGDIKIAEVNLLEKSSIENDYGDVKIGKTNDIYIDAKVDLGDTKISNNNRYSDVVLKIEASCGDIKVEN